MSQNQTSTETTKNKMIYKLNSVKLEKETNQNLDHSLELLSLLVDHVRASFVASRESSIALTRIDDVALWLFTAAIVHDIQIAKEKRADALPAPVRVETAADVSPVTEAGEWEE